MDLDKLPDNEMKPLNIEAIFNKQKRTYFLCIGMLILVNIILFIMLSKEQLTVTRKLYIALKTIGVGSIVLGFGLGLLTALIPYKKFHYSEKYFRASLITILVIQILLIPVQIFFSMYE